MSSSEDDDQAAPEVGRVSNFAKRFEQKINEAAGTQASERKSVSIDTSQVRFHCAFLIFSCNIHVLS